MTSLYQPQRRFFRSIVDVMMKVFYFHPLVYDEVKPLIGL